MAVPLPYYDVDQPDSDTRAFIAGRPEMRHARWCGHGPVLRIADPPAESRTAESVMNGEEVAR